MGRSSNSSHYQLSANRLISRIHVKARYIAGTDPLEANKVEISCCGWNGVKVHCHGQTWELCKGDSFTSATESASIMLDVQDARVFIGWPSHERTASVSRHTDSSWDDEDSPSALVGAVNAAGRSLPSSPLRMHRFVSPVSPTPAGRRASASFPSTLPESGLKSIVQIYEDESSSEQGTQLPQEAPKSQTATEAASQPMTSERASLVISVSLMTRIQTRKMIRLSTPSVLSAQTSHRVWLLSLLEVLHHNSEVVSPKNSRRLP